MLYAVMATRNEAGRWLHESLAQLLTLDIPVLVCDDRSEDETVEIAQGFPNVKVSRRPNGVAPFMQHEGHFREWCWYRMGMEFPVSESDDWVVSIDADEILLGKVTPGEGPISGWTPNRHEVWGFDPEDGAPLIRVDGFWAQAQQPRLARLQPRPDFPDRALASGSIPSYARHEVGHTPWMTIMHLGYACEEDRREKYDRYTDHPFGHNPQHIESILSQPKLERWTYEFPCPQPA